MVMELNIHGEDGGFMITCSKCGAMIEGNPMTCPECGAQIVQDAEQPMDSYSSTDSEGATSLGSKAAESSSSDKTIIVQHKDIFVRILLIILVGCVGYLVVSRFREKNSSDSIDSSNRVLVVYMDNNSSDQSDMTQIKNAFNNGGMIKLDPNNISTDLKWQMESYGAADSDGMYWVTGAVLNYVASRGWNLVQAPTTGLTNCYYFTK